MLLFDSITNTQTNKLNIGQKIFTAIGSIGLLILTLSWLNVQASISTITLYVALLSSIVGIIGFAFSTYQHQPAGIKNNNNFLNSLTNRGLWAWILGIAITGFYVLLYFFKEWLGFSENGNTGLVALFDPLSYALKGKAASQWFVYGTLYTVAILSFGVKFILKYRHNKYQILRTISVMFFQLAFAYLKNMWPLNYYFFEDWHLKGMLGGGSLGLFFLALGIFMIFIGSPILTYFYGKRWYCSWVCGCGGLAETAGDPFRHLSDKSLTSWRIERWLIYSVLIFILLTTALVLYTYFTGNSNILFLNSYDLRSWYGFFIGAIFSGVIGVGFYPILGSRVWCRFGCPMAAILGLQQKFFSRFRITTNGGQCISCGNCSTYCEMGIDVRWYAQRQQNIVRASCVGCGVCSAVCPRGVLKLENGPINIHRLNDPDAKVLD